MEYKDYYRILGVERTAGAGEIKKAFRKLAREHHPDLKPGDRAAEQRFKDVNEAYEVLGDPEKRKRYDLLGADWERMAPGGPAGGPAGGPFAGFDPGAFGRGARGGAAGPGGIRYEFDTAGADAGGFSDFFRMFFGGGGAPFGSETEPAGSTRRGGRGSATATRPAKAPPLEVAVEVGLEEAFHGTTRLLELDGKRLEVRIPRGVDDGSRIRLGGKGGGTGPDARDLVLVTRLLPNATFTRKGADLTRELEIELREALLGGEVRVPTLSGAVLLRIPAGTQSGRTFRLTGQGMPRLNADGRGDLLVRVRVRIPALHDEAQRRAAEAFLGTLDGTGAHGAAA